jgi:hypothetical protein
MSIESRASDLLNNPLKWGQYIPPPAEVDEKDFQKRIDQVAGVSPTSGMSVLKLVWGWHALVRLNGEWRQRYAFHSVTLPSGDVVDIAVPRWFLEELLEPVQYWEEWEKTRWTVDERTQTVVDSLGSPPPNGTYVAAFPIAQHEHNKKCCLRRWAADRRRCVGDYRPPSDQDLEMIQKAVRLREEAKQHNRPDEAVPQEVLDECFKLHYQKKAKWEDDVAYHSKMLSQDFINVYGGNFSSTDPVRWKHGKYRFQNGSIISGATPEEIAKYTKPGFKKVQLNGTNNN